MHLNSRYIKSLQHIRFDLFIDATHDHQSYENEYDSKYSLEPSTFICDASKSGYQTPATKSDEREHE
jgi:hypothetical protein